MKGMDSMKRKNHKRFLAVLTTAVVLAAAVPAVQTGRLVQFAPVSAAETADTALSSDTIHLPDGLLKENGYEFGIRTVGKAGSKKYFLYYRDATERDESGEPQGSIVNIKEIDGTAFPKPDYKTLSNLSGNDATADSPATGEKLEMERLVTQAVEDYFIAEDTGAWYTDVEKVEKVAVPNVVTDGKSTPEPGIVIETEIPETKRLTDNPAFMDILIKAYDSEEGHDGDNSFKNDSQMYDADNSEITAEGYKELFRIFSADIKGFTGKAADAIRRAYSAVVTRTQAQELNRLNREINESDEVDLEKTKWVLETASDLVSSKKVYPRANGNAKFWVTKAGDITSGTLAQEASGSTALVTKTAANGKYNNEIVLKAVSGDYTMPTSKLPDGKGTVYASCTFYVVPAKSTAYKESGLNVSKDVKGIKFAKNENGTYDLSLDTGKSYRLPFALENGTDKTLIYEAEGSGFTVKNGIVKACGEGSGTVRVYPYDCDDKAGMTLTVNVNISPAVRAIRSNTNTISMCPGSVQTVSLGTVPPSFGKYTYAVHGLHSAYTAEIDGDKLTISSDGKKAIPKLNRIAVTILKDGRNVSGIKNMYFTIHGVPFTQEIRKLRESNRKVGSDGTVEINLLKGETRNLGVSVYPVSADATIIPNVGVGLNADGTINTGFKSIVADTYDEFIALYGKGGQEQDLSAVSFVNSTMDRLYSRAIADDDPTAVGRPSVDETGAYTEWLTFYKRALAIYNSVKKSSQVDISALKVSGDVVCGSKSGTYYLQYTSAAKNGSGEALSSNVYKINVYETGASIIMNDMRSTACYDSDGDKKITKEDVPLSSDKTYAIVGGQLMTTKSANTDSARTFKGCTSINIAEPYCIGCPDEEIEWTCSKPGAIRISRGEDYTAVVNGKASTYHTLDLKLCQACLTDQSNQPIPFTITGTSKYMKQKFSFKISVVNDADISQGLNGSRARLEYTDINGDTIAQPKNLNVGDAFVMYCSSGIEGVAGRVKYESTNKKVLKVLSNGKVKAVGKGNAEIKAVMTISDKDMTKFNASVKITVS